MFAFRRRLAATALTALSALALTASSAHAGAITDNADCSAQPTLDRTFLPWADLANYAPAPDGGVEADAAGWTLSGGAAVVNGNSAFFVGGEDHTRKLSLPRGSSAVSAPTCVGLEWPTIRFFARSTGSSLVSNLSTLGVEVLFEEELTGLTVALPIGVVTPGSSWQPTLPMVMVANTLGAVHKGGKIPVAFRFTPTGASGWEIDDLYIDPWRGP
ncbi:MAG: hypothetical protein JWO90_2829 [Solirubrobacterales bacterium]|jgi:hypothetical protein|nr:hypothetical protein [Solirubrobacterales bacterium]